MSSSTLFAFQEGEGETGAKVIAMSLMRLAGIAALAPDKLGCYRIGFEGNGCILYTG
ncbi:MAG: hypothetical protein IPK63_03255 [Candidatus Competibacteraceae bacterium]|nr:hypothetical protein [Candidatus Competibacteraceae bacterium]